MSDGGNKPSGCVRGKLTPYQSWIKITAIAPSQLFRRYWISLVPKGMSQQWYFLWSDISHAAVSASSRERKHVHCSCAYESKLSVQVFLQFLNVMMTHSDTLQPAKFLNVTQEPILFSSLKVLITYIFTHCTAVHLNLCMSLYKHICTILLKKHTITLKLITCG